MPNADAVDRSADPSPRDLVLAFYEAALNQRDIEQAKLYLGDTYIQHNPQVPDGLEGLFRFIRFRHERYPAARNEVKRVIAEDDLVALHVHDNGLF